MRILNSLLIFVVVIAIPFYSIGQRNDKKKGEEEVAIIPEPVYIEGVVYSLPRTGLEIKVSAEMTSFVPGPYAAYAEKYLGIKDVRNVASTNWKIKGIEVKTYTEPDPNAVFKAMNIVASQLSQLPNGIITGIHSKGHFEHDKLIGSDAIVNANSLPTFTDLSSDEYYITAVDPETGTETTNFKSIEEKAREAADYLIRLRKKRAFTILNPSDVVPEDGKGYEVFVKEAKRLEKEYVSLFTGKSVSSTHHFRFTYIPEGDEVKNEVIFRFSEDKGVVSKSDISGKPVMISLTKDSGFAKTINQLKKSDNPKAGESGIYYRIPATAELVITDGLNSIYSGRLSLPQFGAIAPLPENLLDGNYSIEFNPEGGTLQEVKPLK